MIREHALEQDHRFNEENFKIVFRARQAMDVRIAESLFIFKNKPTINNQESAGKLHMFP